jgi:hypothetical protein
MLEYAELVIGKDYFHKDHGRVTLVAPHPWDGCCLVIMFFKDDETHFDTCERHALDHLLVEEEENA